jgi:hypothetical protein
MNEKAEFAVRVIKQYALENLMPARSTSDLSPMEQWLILRLLAVIKSLPDSDEIRMKARDKEKIIASIKQRILDEHRKHKTLDWAEIAARKIYSIRGIKA